MLSNINGYNIKPEWFLGKGSFASVYKAEKNGHFFAIKIFQSELLQTEYKDRLDREIMAIQKITHPNVTKIHDFGKFKDEEFEHFYIVMDLIEGMPLTELVGLVDEAEAVGETDVELSPDHDRRIPTDRRAVAAESRFEIPEREGLPEATVDSKAQEVFDDRVGKRRSDAKVDVLDRWEHEVRVDLESVHASPEEPAHLHSFDRIKVAHLS